MPAAAGQVAHPQTNEQVEAVNKIIKHTIKAKLDSKKGKWAGKLPEVLWAYKTPARTSMVETPFAMAFRVEAVIPIEMRIQSRVHMYDHVQNISALESNLDELESRRDKAQIRNTIKISLNTNDKSARSLADKWEGLYKIFGQAGHRCYKIARLEGGTIVHPWNGRYLKLYYP
ncbi:hypothetical protein ACOSP7_027100 [Xanthoceras sorbifolium]